VMTSALETQRPLAIVVIIGGLINCHLLLDAGGSVCLRRL
jgi:Cu/Ag efflux pump CusA